MKFKEALVLRAFAAWTVFVWVVFVRNILGQNHSFGFKAIHVLLALVSVAFAVLCLGVVRQVRRRAKEPIASD